MKALIATYTFREKMEEYSRHEIDFNNFFYVPTVDEITKDIHHQREDHNHVLKRIAKSVRDDNVPGVSLIRFREAMLDRD